ncbi:MAG: hypothetical protein V9H69_02680 [Anaerolineae bacterium]
MASFLLALAFIVPSLINRTGNLQDPVGPLAYVLAFSIWTLNCASTINAQTVERHLDFVCCVI